MTIGALTKAVGILALLVILVGVSVYVQKPSTPVPQQAARESPAQQLRTS